MQCNPVSVEGDPGVNCRERDVTKLIGYKGCNANLNPSVALQTDSGTATVTLQIYNCMFKMNQYQGVKIYTQCSS